MKLRSDAELNELIKQYIVTRDDNGLCAHPGEADDNFREDGLTDFDYLYAPEESKMDPGQWAEILEIGAMIAVEAAGRDIWYTSDGVGLRIFFGPLEEIKERIRQRIIEIPIKQIMEE